ncbi:MAG TPA: glycosyltransferase family 4 protein [Pyrinomonadaceae bacterium]|nr:glycosyltransferase family 4 protein [Pyrinomonadaceae bacterium]
MTRAAILTSHISTGSAVSSDVLGMRIALEKQGIDARLYAESSDLEQPKIWPPNEIKGFLKDRDDILIYHHSIGWNAALGLLQGLKCRTVIKYHNITPPSFFSGISTWHEEKCREGREQLQAIVDGGCDLYLSASDYNQDELLAAGADELKSFVIPPFHEIDRLQSLDADLDTLDQYRDGRAIVLSVSRVAPHKGHPDLIEAFASFHHYYNQNSRLLIVGREEEAFAGYSKRLREMVEFLLLEDAVAFAGEVSDATLRACYLLANVFVSASKHEGFCLPLVEAMAMKVPIVSYDSAAIPETLGAAGIVLPDRDAALMAESINLLTNDEPLNVQLGIEGRRRYEHHFATSVIEMRFLRALGTLS